MKSNEKVSDYFDEKEMKKILIDMLEYQYINNEYIQHYGRLFTANELRPELRLNFFMGRIISQALGLKKEVDINKIVFKHVSSVIQPAHSAIIAFNDMSNEYHAKKKAAPKYSKTFSNESIRLMTKYVFYLSHIKLGIDDFKIPMSENPAFSRTQHNLYFNIQTGVDIVLKMVGIEIEEKDYLLIKDQMRELFYNSFLTAFENGSIFQRNIDNEIDKLIKNIEDVHWHLYSYRGVAKPIAA